ncbi:MAG: energy transducer TonB [Draconibacterium sp.]
MKKLIYIIILLLPLVSTGQKDTVYYFGVNGKLNPSDKQDMMKKVDFKGSGRARIKTYKNTDEGWVLVFTEKLKPQNDSVYCVQIKSDEFTGKLIRTFKPLADGKFEFTDRLNTAIKRTGITTQKSPLILDGKMRERYNSGVEKSISVYRNNELISNKTRLPDGTQLVDNIFYSVDSDPRFEPGIGFLNQQIRKAIKDAKFDLLTVEGRMVVGLVITKDGKIGGVQIVKGISQTLNGILADAFSKLEGAWVPAKLNGEPVSYFLMFPINFIYNKYDFDYLEMKKGMMYWMIN